MQNKKKSQKGKNVNFQLKTNVYPLEVIYLACYSFIDRVYVYLDEKRTGTIEVLMEQKEPQDDLKKIAGEFHNELLFAALRQKISKNNKKLREALVFSALFSTQGGETQSLIDTGEMGKELEEEIGDDWKDDPLGIAVPWEEKVETAKPASKKKSTKKTAKKVIKNKKNGKN